MRELLFGVFAAALITVYLMLGMRVVPLLTPAAAPTPKPTKPVEPVASTPVEGTIVFAIRGDLYALSGGSYGPLTTDGRWRQPSLSRDGQTVVAARTAEIEGKRSVDGQTVPAHLGYSDVVAIAVGGHETTTIASGVILVPSGFHEVTWYESPVLSPDRKLIAVIAVRASSGLELLDATSGRTVTRLPAGADTADPAWSPDGASIAVTSYAFGAPRLLILPTNGASARALTIGAEGEPYRPSLSPDGKWVMYTLRHDQRNDLHVSRLSGGADVAITTDGKSWNGVFSPDGSHVAFFREHNGGIDLYTMDIADALAGGGPAAAVQITHGEGVDSDSRPAWGN